jgi:hypothetical protein
MSVLGNRYNEEQLPIIHDVEAMPRRCVGCPGSLKRVIETALEQGDDYAPQVVSDAVQTMRICTTGPVQQREYAPTEATEPYWHPAHEYIPRNYLVGGNRSMVRTDETGTPVAAVTFGEAATGNTVEVCGLEARADRIPRSALMKDRRLKARVQAQGTVVAEHTALVELACNPTKQAQPFAANPTLTLLLQRRPRDDPRNRNLMQHNLKALNHARTALGMARVVATAELYELYGLTPPKLKV